LDPLLTSSAVRSWSVFLPDPCGKLRLVGVDS
jgi:hypothetical protein